MAGEGRTQEAIGGARELEAKLDGPLYYSPSQVLRLIPRDRFIYIYSLYGEVLSVAKGSLGVITIPACDPGQPYSKPLRLGTVVSTTYYDAMTNSMKTDDVEGQYIAQDIVHPYLAGDWSAGQNLDDFGVFWTWNETPTEAELAAARGKMEKMFRQQLIYASQLENKNQLEFITPLMRFASNYFKEDRQWNKTYKRLEDCPGCGQNVKPGIIKHNCGYIFNWTLALANGMATLEQAELAGIDPKTGKSKKGKKPGSDE